MKRYNRRKDLIPGGLSLNLKFQEFLKIRIPELNIDAQIHLIGLDNHGAVVRIIAGQEFQFKRIKYDEGVNDEV